MNLRILPFVLVSLVIAGFGADSESSRKQSELSKLLEHTKELQYFQYDIKVAVDALRKSQPEVPSGFWDEVVREVRVGDYARWIFALLDRSLTEGEVRELNTVMSDENNRTLLYELLQKFSGKKGKEFAIAVEDYFRSPEKPSHAKEVVAFLKSETAVKYAAILTEKFAGQGEIAAKLLGEAQGIVNARRK
jgi:hypothetical protein